MSKLKDNPLRPFLKKLLFKMSVLLVITYIITALISFSFDVKMIVGLLVGFAFMIASNFFMADCMYYGVMLNRLHAKKIIVGSYFLRYILLFLICVFGYKFVGINPFGVLIPQFYPRIAMTFDNLFKKGVKNNADSADKHGSA